MPHGPDFPEFARTLIATDGFGLELILLTTMALMSAKSFSAKLASIGDGNVESEEFKQSIPVAPLVLKLMYAGFQLGRQEAEIEALERMRGRMEATDATG